MKFISLLIMSVVVSLSQSFAQSKTSNLHFGFIYPISSNGKNALEYSNNYSFNAIAGVSKNERKFNFSGVTSFVTDSCYGLQLSGFFNYVGKVTTGVQIAGFLNYSGGGKASQIAGFANIMYDDGARLQLAGFMNKSGNVNNQLSGFINIAKKVRGVQVSGFINIADSSDYPIGIVNIIKKGEKEMALSYDETFTGLIAFKSGGRVLYGILGAGYNFKKDVKLYVMQTGLGAHIKLSNLFRINMEGTMTVMSKLKDDIKEMNF